MNKIKQFVSVSADSTGQYITNQTYFDASYAGTPKKATSIGPITAAALIPANPVPMPAPAPARKIHKRQF